MSWYGDTEFRYPSAEESFRKTIDTLSDFGTWSIRKRASYGGCAEPYVATLHGARGTVEVWGGAHHAHEVWVIGKDKSETEITRNWTTETLHGYVETACAAAGVQTRMEVMANDEGLRQEHGRDTAL